MSKTKTLLLLIGPQASGKSTWTQQFLKENPNWVALSRDSYRYLLRNEYTCESKIELLISDLMDNAIIQALNKNLNVIIDNTNTRETIFNHFIKLVKYDANVEFKVFHETLDICLERNRNRPPEKKVKEQDLIKFYNEYKNLIRYYEFKPISKTPSYLNRFVPAEQNILNPMASIWDFDGNISIMADRSPFDWKKVYLDTPNNFVIEQLKLNRISGNKILIVTGRDEVCRKECIEWLNFYNIPFDQLFMRPFNDNRKDSIIKKEIYINKIKENYNVISVWDDRISVVKECWYRLGIFCFCTNQNLISF